MGTEVIYAAGLPRANVVLCDSVPAMPLAEEAFLSHRLLVMDGYDWGPALAHIQQHGLDPRRREFKEPFSEKPVTPDVQAAVQDMVRQVKSLYPRMYGWPATLAHSSFRPMITGPEPMHYDSYGGEYPLVTAYINVSAEPRVYRISYTFEQLVHEKRDEVRAAFKERRKHGDDASYPIRMRTQKGRGPLGPDAPRHEVRMAPGAVWFFNAKTVSHEVVHGTGAIGIGWEVPTSKARLQHDIMKGRIA